jgi:hypothetical protein
MKKSILIIFILIVYSGKTYSQACGGGMIEFKIFNKEILNEITIELFYVLPETLDSLCTNSLDGLNCDLHFTSGAGKIINNSIGENIQGQSFKPLKLSIDSNNIFKVITPELSKSMAVIKIKYDRQIIYLLTNGSGCIDGKNAIIINNNTKIIHLDYKINLQKLKQDDLIEK